MKRVLIGLLVSSLLVGCGGESYSDLRQWVKEQGQGLKGKVDPLPEVKPYEPFNYDAFELPDPFKPRKLTPNKGGSGGGGLQPDFDRRKEALEAFPLESLKMVGTMQQSNVMHALIKAPDNNLYRVKIGNYMGQSFGIITNITEADIELKEIIQDSTGDWTERTSKLQLLEEEQKK